jgi:hypothetical protein
MSEDKNLNGIMDSEEGLDIAIDMAMGVDESVTMDIATPSEAKGSGASEAAEVTDSEVEVSATAGAFAETETEKSVDEVVEEAPPLTVTLTFGDETVEIVVTNHFQLDLRKACQDKNSRYDEFEVEGELTPLNLRLLMNALK